MSRTGGTAGTYGRSVFTAPQLNQPQLPKGGGALRGLNDAFQPQAYTGTAGLTIPLPVSPCRGFEPRLALTYDSATGNGPFGVGFSLSAGQISRNTEKRIPGYTEADTFVLSGAGELVRRLRPAPEGWAPVRRVVSEGDTVWEVAEYRPRLEQGFARIEYWLQVGAGETHWQVTDGDNVVHIFGRAAHARIADRAHPERVLTWLLESSTDARGNVIVYDYRSENDEHVPGDVDERDRARGAQRYLHKVRYGPYENPSGGDKSWHFELVFDYGERDFSAPERIAYEPQTPWPVRADPFSTYRPGFELRTRRLCHAALLYHRFPHLNGGAPQPVCALRFFYDQTPTMSFLTALAEVGFRRTGEGRLEVSERPPLELNYSRSDPTYLFSLGGQFARYFEPGPVPEALRTEFRLNEILFSPAAQIENAGEGSWFITDAAETYLVERGHRVESERGTAMPPDGRDAAGLDVFQPARAPQFKPLLVDGGALPGFVDRGQYQMVDLDGEGLPGMLYADGTTVLYWKPRGAGVLAPPQSPHAFPLPRLGGQAASFLSDVAANGLLDLEVLADAASGVYPRRPDGSWGEFLPYEGLPTELFTPGHVFVDTNGDGRSDLLLFETDEVRVYRSKGYRGYAAARSCPKPAGFPLTTAPSEREAIRFADIFGDGGSHLLRITNGSVECWPNLGHGRFGARVALADAPHYAEELDPARLFLADIDGSGTADLIYVERERMLVYFNRSGNGFSPQPLVVMLPRQWNDIAALNFADVLGNGTACAVLTTLDESGRAHHQYYDFTGGVKPHLLTEVDNNMGALTRVSYAPSTRFYLEDARAGRPWPTRLPFPVQVIEQVETIDQIADTRQTQRYRYHDGYYDPVAREFRGFGLVETWDGERFDLFAEAPGEAGVEVADALNAGLLVAPAYTKTWYHTGAFFESGLISKQYAAEYFAGDAGAVELPDSDFGPAVMEAEAETLREAFAALQGSVLRQEVYGLDAWQNPDLISLPYTVTETSYHVRLLQPRAEQKHASFLTYERESLTYTYERNPHDPRTEHTFTVEVDPYGHTLKSCTVYYPRRVAPNPESLNPAEQIQPEQTRLRAVAQVAEYINKHEPFYLLGVPRQQQSFELYGLTPGAGGYFTSARLAEQLHEALDNVIAFDDPPVGSAPQARLLSWARQYYVDTSVTSAPLLQSPLPFGEVSAQALLAAGPSALFPATQLERVYGSRVSPEDLTAAGYYPDQASGYWWNPGLSYGYAGAGQFYLPLVTVDPFEATTTARYDPFNLAVTILTDAVGNRTAGEIDYQSLGLSPRRVVDINDNFYEVVFDPLGEVIVSSMQGRVGGAVVGDAPLDEYRTSVDGHAVFHTAVEKILDQPAAYLQNATSFFAYDLWAWRLRRQPPCSVSLNRTTHVYEHRLAQSEAEPAPGPGEILQTLGYFDGFARVVETKQKVDPGRARTLDSEGQLMEVLADDRWLTTGRTVYNSKGATVKEYEPYFTATALYEPESVLTRFGVTPVLHYDPLLRPVRTDLPQGYFTKVTRTAWAESFYDANDTILASPYFTEHGPLDADERAALRKAVVCADTPTTQVFDNLGRAFLTVQMLTRSQEATVQPAPGRTTMRYLSTRQALDIQGNVVSSIDPRFHHLNQVSGSTHANFLTVYDMAGNVLVTRSADAGEHSILRNASGSPILSWDSRGFLVSTQYDALQREKQVSVKGDDGRGLALNQVVEFVNYGDEPGYANPQENNLRGRPVERYDQAGKLTYQTYDLAGALLESTRQFRLGYRTEADWQVVNGQVQAEHQLEPEIYYSASAYDAVGRLTSEVAPDGSGVRDGSRFSYRYNPQGWPTRVEVLQPGQTAQVFVRDISYNARGQRTEITYGNEAVSRYEYDPRTFLLTRLRTRRRGRAKDLLQDLNYTYDPVGNISSVSFTGQTPVFHANAQVLPRADYTYDSLYRLVEATGREHAGLAAAAHDPAEQYLPKAVVRLNDDDKLTAYTQRFNYDEGGNLRRVRHVAREAARCFTRRFAVAGPATRPGDAPSNRLTGVGTRPIACTPDRSHFTPGPSVSEAVSYDANGNMETLEGNRKVYWNYRDNIWYVPVVQRRDGQTDDAQYYVYDFAGRRVRRVTEHLKNVETGLVEVEEKFYFGTFELLRRRVVAAGAEERGTLKLERRSLQVRDGSDRVALVHRWTIKPAGKEKLPDAQIRYQLDDHLGSVLLELDESAGVLTYEEYFPYGGTSFKWGRNRLDAALKEYRYSGKERDDATGLYYYGARYYASWLCRWLSPDPAGTIDGLNLYAFVSGNPVTLADARGLMGNKRKRAAPKKEPKRRKFEDIDEPEALKVVRIEEGGDWVAATRKINKNKSFILNLFPTEFGGAKQATLSRSRNAEGAPANLFLEKNKGYGGGKSTAYTNLLGHLNRVNWKDFARLSRRIIKGTLADKGKGIPGGLTKEAIAHAALVGSLAMTSEKTRSWVSPFVALVTLGFAKQQEPAKGASPPRKNYNKIYIPSPTSGTAGIGGAELASMFGKRVKELQNAKTLTDAELEDFYNEEGGAYKPFFDAAGEYLSNKTYFEEQKYIGELAQKGEAGIVRAFIGYTFYQMDKYPHLY